MINKKALVLSNMYPTSKYPHYGIFVKNTNSILKNEGFHIQGIYVYKTKYKVLKLIMYLIFYIKSVYCLNFRSYDLVYIHYPAFSAIPLINFNARFCNKKAKVIVNIHGNDLIPEEERDKKFLKFTDIAISKSNYVFVPSNYFKNIFSERYPDYEQNNIYIYPSGGVNRKVFNPISKNRALLNLNLNDNYHYIGFVSRIEKNKGWDVFIDCINELRNILPNYRFIMVGSGNQEEYLESMIKRENLESRIIKYGYLDHFDLNNIFNAIDILCFPSLRKSESLGLVGLEAMACKTMVISTSGTGPASYIKNNYSGFIINKMCSNELANKILEIVDYSEEQKEYIIENAYESTKSYEKSNVADNLSKFINKVFLSDGK